MDEELRRQLQAMQTEIDNVGRGVTRLTRAIQEADELEDHLDERRERAEEEERDERHKQIMGRLGGIIEGLAGLTKLINSMPEAMLRAVEDRVNDLRKAAYDAQRAGASTPTPPPLPPPPVFRDHTGPVPLQPQLPPHVDDEEPWLTKGQQKTIVHAVKKHWKWSLLTPFVAAAGKGLHEFVVWVLSRLH